MKSCNRSDRSNSKISVFINKQTYKRLKENDVRTPSERNMWSLHLDRASSSLSVPVVCFLSSSLSITLSFFLSVRYSHKTARRSNQLFGQRLQQPQSTSALFCDWRVVTMAATSAVGSGGMTSQRLRWRACRRQRGNVIVMLLQLKIWHVTLVDSGSNCG